MSLRSLFFCIVILVVALTQPLNAQSVTDTLNEKRYGILPIVSFNSDRGFIGGMEVQEFDYRGETLPFRSYTVANFMYNSALGAFNAKYYRDQVRTFGTTVRTTFGANSSLGYGNYFPGITVSEGFDRTRFDTTQYYQFNAFSFSTFVSTRWPWFLGEFIQRSDTRISLEFVYHNPFELETYSYLAENRPAGFDYTRNFYTEIGFQVERRNSEFQAQKGYVYSFNAKSSIPFISTQLHGSVGGGGAVFFPLVASRRFSLTWASRVTGGYHWGDVPFWYMPFIGGYNLRGYMWLRETGYALVNYSTELRSWFLSIPYKDIRLGLNLFADGGSVYDRKINLAEPHLFTVGFGGVMSIFTPDYIMKFDIGFSKEGMGIYLGTGYSF